MESGNTLKKVKSEPQDKEAPVLSESGEKKLDKLVELLGAKIASSESLQEAEGFGDCPVH